MHRELERLELLFESINDLDQVITELCDGRTDYLDKWSHLTQQSATVVTLYKLYKNNGELKGLNA